MRSTKSEMYKQLKSKRNSKEFEEWFLNYIPKISIKNKGNSRVTKSKTVKKSKSKTTKSKSRTTKSRTAKSRIAKSNIVKSKLYNLFN